MLTLFFRALIKNLQGDIAGALDREINLTSTKADAFYRRGAVKQTAGDLDGAIADFTKAIAINPKYAGAYAARASSKRVKGDLKGYEADRDQARNLEPDSC